MIQSAGNITCSAAPEAFGRLDQQATQIMRFPAAAIRRIALILPYFGSFPKWIDLYFKTCSVQQDFQWLVFTDQDAARWSNRYGNVSFTEMTLGEFLRRAGDVLGCSFSKSCHPKKACDFRPMFGRLFERELRGYEFWGHVDHDLFVGRLGFFLGPYFDSNDVLSTHHSRIAGPLTIYRNTAAVNDLFRTIPDWESALQDSNIQHYCEEEHFTRAVRQAASNGLIRPRFAAGPTAHDQSPFECVYQDGRILRVQNPLGKVAELARKTAHRLSLGRISYWPVPREYMYFHFRLWKDLQLQYTFDENAVSGWRVGRTGISSL